MSIPPPRFESSRAADVLLRLITRLNGVSNVSRASTCSPLLSALSEHLAVLMTSCQCLLKGFKRSQLVLMSAFGQMKIIPFVFHRRFDWCHDCMYIFADFSSILDLQEQTINKQFTFVVLEEC